MYEASNFVQPLARPASPVMNSSSAAYRCSTRSPSERASTPLARLHTLPIKSSSIHVNMPRGFSGYAARSSSLSRMRGPCEACRGEESGRREVHARAGACGRQRSGVSASWRFLCQACAATGGALVSNVYDIFCMHDIYTYNIYTYIYAYNITYIHVHLHASR